MQTNPGQLLYQPKTVIDWSNLKEWDIPFGLNGFIEVLIHFVYRYSMYACNPDEAAQTPILARTLHQT